MPKKVDRPMHRTHVRIYDEDWRELVALYGENVGVNEAIRRIVHAFMVQNHARLREVIDQVESEDQYAAG